MDLATIIGIVLGFTLVGGAIAMGGNFILFVDPKSIMIVAGGTIAVTLISYPLAKVLGVIKDFDKPHLVWPDPALQRAD